MIPTREFLRACEAIGDLVSRHIKFLLDISDFLALLGRAFGTLRTDIMENVEKVRNRFDQDQRSYRNLQDLVNHDLMGNGWQIVDDSPSQGVLWLKRWETSPQD